MVIITRGNWQASTLSEKAEQLNSIYMKALAYKSTLDILSADIDRIKSANLMCQYIIAARTLIVAWDRGLTNYNEQLLMGNMLEVMNAFPATPTLDTPPDAGSAGIWHFLENRRKTWMAHPNFTTTIGVDMKLIGPEKSLDTDTYKPLLTAKTGAEVIHVKTDSTDIDIHNLFAGIIGQPLTFITSFKGSKFDYKRVLAVAGVAESVNLQVQGVYQNEPIGKMSDVFNIAYNG